MQHALDRLLCRLSVSPYRERFILKSAMLYAAWLNDLFRATRDLDLLSLGEGEARRFMEIFGEICAQPVADDGLIFGAGPIVAQPIREDATYGGLRLRTSAHLETAVIPIRIDIGFGDAVTPGPLELDYPLLLDQLAPRLNTYPRDTVAAEKFEAIVALDMVNSRMKDFYDLLALSRLFTFEGVTLAAAIRATFERRRTDIPREHPPPLTSAFAEDALKVQQWRSFIARETLMFDEPDLPSVVREIGVFIMPAARAAIDSSLTPGCWIADCGSGRAWRPVQT